MRRSGSDLSSAPFGSDLVRGALAALLGLEPDIEVVAQVGRGDEVVEAARASEATVGLRDIDGIAAPSLLGTQVPGCRALIVTTFGRPGYLARAMQAGASGFVAARAGGSIVDIARMVHLSEGTVKNRLSSAIGKTGGRNRADAVRVAVERGWL